jgi:NADPH:quinone reductase-like Zn-dependent oxidoreductase
MHGMPSLFPPVRRAPAAAHPAARDGVQEGTRIVAVPWPTMGGAGTWQQYVCVPEEHLVRADRCLQALLSIARACAVQCF